MNRVILIGNLGADPELKYTQSGKAMLRMRLATSERWKDQNGERKERTEWHALMLWGPRAEALSRILRKGDRIACEGKIRTNAWEKDGEKRYSTEIMVDEVELLGGKGRADRAEDDSPGEDELEPDDLPF